MISLTGCWTAVSADSSKGAKSKSSKPMDGRVAPKEMPSSLAADNTLNVAILLFGNLNAVAKEEVRNLGEYDADCVCVSTAEAACQLVWLIA